MSRTRDLASLTTNAPSPGKLTSCRQLGHGTPVMPCSELSGSSAFTSFRGFVSDPLVSRSGAMSSGTRHYLTVAGTRSPDSNTSPPRQPSASFALPLWPTWGAAAPSSSENIPQSSYFPDSQVSYELERELMFRALQQQRQRELLLCLAEGNQVRCTPARATFVQLTLNLQSSYLMPHQSLAPTCCVSSVAALPAWSLHHGHTVAP